MVVFPQRVTKLGVVVLPGAKLIAINSQFIGLGTCIDVHNAGEAILSECLFQQSGDGFQVNKLNNFYIPINMWQNIISAQL